jgi:hypothetical protein
MRCTTACFVPEEKSFLKIFSPALVQTAKSYANEPPPFRRQSQMAARPEDFTCPAIARLNRYQPAFGNGGRFF